MRHDIRLDDRIISYLESAPLGPVPSRVLVFLHAFPLNAAMWEAQIAAGLPSWRFLAPDLRGFGESTHHGNPDRDSADLDGGGAGPQTRVAEISIDDYADDVVVLLDSLRIERAVVAGLSMGGYAALALVRRAPDRVAGLSLCDTKAEADGEEARGARAGMIRLLDEQGVPAVADQMMPRLLAERTRSTRPDIEQRVRRIMLANQPGGVRDGLVRMMRRPDSARLLRGLTCPALVIVGDEDRTTPPEVARTMQQHIAGAELATIAQAGHLSNVEQPDRFNDALFGFLRNRLGG